MARIDRTRMEAWRSFLEAHSALTGVLEEELVAARQLPLAWYDVLLQLSEAPGGRMRMLDLAHAVLLSKSGLTRLFDRMEDGGLVRREPYEEDRRGTMAVMTAKGRSTLRRAAPVHQRGIDEHFARHITDAEARTMRAAFRKLNAALDDGE